MDISSHVAWFGEYARAKIAGAKTDPEPVELKFRHTSNVLANAAQIAKDEAFSQPVHRACLLAALYHDIARFDQYLIYHTFKDKISRNHGMWGAAKLKMAGILADEPENIQRMVLTAIRMHNRRSLPSHLERGTHIVCQTVRDADKIDIARVMDEHLSQPGPYNPTIVLGLPDLPDLYSRKVLECALKGTTAFYDDLKSLNDFRVLLATWHYDLSFASSKALYRRKGNAADLTRMLPDNEIYGPVKKHLLADLNPV